MHHPDHSSFLPRLARIGGQVEGVKRMIEDQRYCPDILAQLRAIRAALGGIEADLLERHLDHCVTGALASGDPAQRQAKLAELKQLYRRFGG